MGHKNFPVFFAKDSNKCEYSLLFPYFLLGPKYSLNTLESGGVFVFLLGEGAGGWVWTCVSGLSQNQQHRLLEAKRQASQ